MEFTSFSLDEVDNAFSKLITLKHLNGLRFESLKRPTLLVTDSKNILKPSIKDEDRNISFLTSITQTLRGGGKVLIPTDAAGRVLELVLTLEEYWLKNKLNFPLILLGTVAYSTVNFASCQLEWMHSSISSTFEKDRDNPFDFRCFRFCNNLDDLKKIDDGPIVVLASSPLLETGFAKQIAIDWIQCEQNAILFTDPIREESLAHKLIQNQNKSITISISKRVPLTDAELEKIEADRQKELSEGGHESKAADSLDQSGQMLGEISISEGVPGVSGITRGLSIEETADMEMKHCLVSGTLIDGFDPPDGTDFPLFPFQSSTELNWDVFGESFDETELLNLQSTKEDQSLLTGAPMVVDEETPELPTKIVTEERSFEIRGSISCFDFSAHSNSHFMRHFVSYLHPRNLILINGSTESHELLSEAAKTGSSFLRQTGRVLCPVKQERVELLDQLDCFGVVLEKQLMSRLEWKKSSLIEAAWAEGQLQISEDNPGLIKMLPLNSKNPESSNRTGLYVGDCCLSTIKKKVETLGMRTAFQEGKLVCNGLIQIQIGSQSRITIEGPLCTDYYLIRQAIDEMYKLN
eukprot:g7428.t1